MTQLSFPVQSTKALPAGGAVAVLLPRLLSGEPMVNAFSVANLASDSGRTSPPAHAKARISDFPLSLPVFFYEYKTKIITSAAAAVVIVFVLGWDSGSFQHQSKSPICLYTGEHCTAGWHSRLIATRLRVRFKGLICKL